jgi:hypothetical protein
MQRPLVSPSAESCREMPTPKSPTIPAEVGVTSGALILFNAMSLYELLTPSEGLVPILELHSRIGAWKSTFDTAFAEALKKNYDSVFVYARSVLGSLPSAPYIDAGLEALYGAVQPIASKATLLRNDLSGRIYHSALAKSVAKAYATFYTRIPAGELIAWFAIDNYRAQVSDFACGSGTLLVAAYHKKLALAFSQGFTGSVADLHRAFLHEDLWGFDAMPFASHLSMVNLALQQPAVTFRAGKVYFVPCGGSRMGSLDLLKAPTVSVQQRIDDPTSHGAVEQAMIGKSSAVSLDVPRNHFDLVVMNPPFTRNDRASRVLDRPLLRRTLEAIGASLTVAGLSAPFVYLGNMSLKAGGRLGLVLPAATLFAESWTPVRRLLLDNYHVELIAISWASKRPAFSEHSKFREIIIIAKKKAESSDSTAETPQASERTILAAILQETGILDAREIAETLRLASLNAAAYDMVKGSPGTMTAGGDQVGSIVSALPTLLERSIDNWYRLVAMKDPSLGRLCLALDGVLPLPQPPMKINLAGKLCKLSEIADVTLFMKNVSTAGYRIYSTHPGPGGVRFIDGVDLSTMSVKPLSLSWIRVDPTLPKAEKFVPQPARLQVVRKTNVYSSLRATAATVEGADAIGGMFFPVHPHADLRTSDDVPVTEEEVAKLECLWFNSTLGLLVLLSDRAETEGAFMSWPTERLRVVRALDPRKLTRAQVDVMLSVWPTISNVELEVLPSQITLAAKDPKHPRRILDERLLSLLTRAKTPELMELYRRLGSELEALRAVMSRGGFSPSHAGTETAEAEVDDPSESY